MDLHNHSIAAMALIVHDMLTHVRDEMDNFIDVCCIKKGEKCKVDCSATPPIKVVYSVLSPNSIVRRAGSTPCTIDSSIELHLQGDERGALYNSGILNTTSSQETHRMKINKLIIYLLGKQITLLLTPELITNNMLSYCPTGRQN